MKRKETKGVKHVRCSDEQQIFAINSYARDNNVSFSKAANELIEIGIKNQFENAPPNLDRYTLDTPIPRLDEYCQKRINGMKVIDAVKHGFLGEEQIMGIYQSYNDLKDEFELKEKQPININRQQ